MMHTLCTICEFHFTTNSDILCSACSTSQPTTETADMEAATIMRKVKELDALEKRIRQTLNPSQVLLRQIQLEREQLLNPKEPPK